MYMFTKVGNSLSPYTKIVYIIKILTNLPRALYTYLHNRGMVATLCTPLAPPPPQPGFIM